ncbi:MAG: hypothetical protein Q8873_05860 [Bacillota bacterium]|nr:hypothetical protein [Bacillota bacterium]
MLYKQNSQKKLNPQLFQNPTKEYRGTPFWSWNCDLNEGLLERQISILKEMGFGGFHMHSRPGMSMPYLGDVFMSRIKFCVEEAKKNDMLAWLYDEDRWPSGSAGGLVTRDKKLRNKYILFSPTDPKNDVPREQAEEEGKPYFAAAYDIIKDEKGSIVSYKIMDRDATAEGEPWYSYIYTFPDKQPWYNGNAYVDAMDEGAIAKFVDITYNSYKKAVGDDFNEAVPAIFTDEPHLFGLDNSLPKFATGKTNVKLPWSRFLAEKYKEKYGESIFDILPEVIWDKADGKYSWKRHRFYDFISERFCIAFADQCGAWCKENGISFTGHMLHEQTLEGQTNCMGDCMRPYRALQIPGIDMLRNAQELITAKQCQSAVHQYGREAMLSELYGVTNWTFDFRGHKYQGDWQAAMGVTVRVPHLSWVSMQGEAKRDYPASISYQSPWYKEYSYIENHFARVNTALTRGKPVVKVGVIHPLESYWLLRGPVDTSTIATTAMEEKFENITRWLLEGQQDYNFISESLLPSLTSENPKAVGKMEYEAIVVPSCITLRSTTLEFLKNFKKSGGTVIFAGSCPTYVDAMESGAVEDLYKTSITVGFDKPSILNALIPFATVSIINQNGIPANDYFYNMRQDDKDRWLFVIHAKQREVTTRSSGIVSFKDLRIDITGEYYPVLYDTITGEIKAVPYEISNGHTYINRRMFENDSLLLKLCADNSEIPQETNERTYETEKSTDIKTTVKYTRHEPNVLLLDMAEMAFDDEPFMPVEEILRAYGVVRNKAGWPYMIGEQPWVLPNGKPTHTATLRFTINSEIDYSSPVLALELADITEITWNGKKITNKPEGYYVDESIGKVALPPLKKGTNELILKIPLALRTTVEYCYLLGEFDVKLAGATATIVEKSDSIGFGTITTQGLPFYGGNVDYSFDIDVEKAQSIQIHAFKYAGSLINVSFDGKPVGKIVFEPYNLIIDDVPAGKHTITLTCFGNRNNTFGALHCFAEGVTWFGPDVWRTRADNWAYEYNLAPTGILVSPKIDFLK